MSDSVRMIKKYPNRRLYDTANSGYITLVDVKQMVLEGIDFQVVDVPAEVRRTREEAEKLKAELEEAGATVELK